MAAQALKVEQLVFTPEAGVDAFQYEVGGAVVAGWPVGTKVVDLVANQPPGPALADIVWLIEAKDYRIITNPPKPANLGKLAETMLAKVVSTVAGLPQVAALSTDAAAKDHAHRASAPHPPRLLRVVLHLEPHPVSGASTALFPAGFAANVFLRLKQLVYHIDPSPLVLDIARTPAVGVPWTVA